jgi:nucleoside-triphosphatase THEP1
MFTLPAPDETGVVILISGGRRAGKTTVLLKVREAAVRLRMGGFLSVARFEDGEKTGIDLMDAATGEVMPLAVAESSPQGTEGIRTGHYRFHPAALAAGLRWAEAGREANVFFVDELGPLELVHGEGWVAVIPMIRAQQFGAALVVVRPELIEIAREQMNLPPDTPVIVVNEENREAVADRLANWIKRRASE